MSEIYNKTTLVRFNTRGKNVTHRLDFPIKENPLISLRNVKQYVCLILENIPMDMFEALKEPVTNVRITFGDLTVHVQYIVGETFKVVLTRESGTPDAYPEYLFTYRDSGATRQLYSDLTPAEQKQCVTEALKVRATNLHIVEVTLGGRTIPSKYL